MFCLPFPDGRLPARQFHNHLGITLAIALSVDSALHSCQASPRFKETQTKLIPLSARGEKRIKGPSHHFSFHAVPVVPEFQFNQSGMRLGRNNDGFRARLTGVPKKLLEDFLRFPAIHLDFHLLVVLSQN
jgi:hypothetical protein